MGLGKALQRIRIERIGALARGATYGKLITAAQRLNYRLVLFRVISPGMFALDNAELNFAPINFKGWPTLFIGLLLSDSSPVRTKCRFSRPTNNPSINRIVVPEFPQSKTLSGS